MGYWRFAFRVRTDGSPPRNPFEGRKYPSKFVLVGLNHQPALRFAVRPSQTDVVLFGLARRDENANAKGETGRGHRSAYSVVGLLAVAYFCNRRSLQVQLWITAVAVSIAAIEPDGVSIDEQMQGLACLD